jgi:hypothetical protein
MSKGPVHLVAVEHVPHYADDIATQLADCHTVGLELVGSSPERREMLEGAFQTIAAPGNPIRTVFNRLLVSTVNLPTYAKIVWRLRNSGTDTRLLDISDKDPEYQSFMLAQESDGALARRLEARLPVEDLLYEKIGQVQARYQSNVERDRKVADQADQLSQNPNRLTGIVVGAGHIAIKGMLEEMNHPVSTVTIGALARYKPYAYQLFEALRQGGMPIRDTYERGDYAHHLRATLQPGVRIQPLEALYIRDFLHNMYAHYGILGDTSGKPTPHHSEIAENRYRTIEAMDDTRVAEILSGYDGMVQDGEPAQAIRGYLGKTT